MVAVVVVVLVVVVAAAVIAISKIGMYTLIIAIIIGPVCLDAFRVPVSIREEKSSVTAL